VVVAGSPERVEALNVALWTYDDRGFLPHGSRSDGFAEDQPIWLTDRIENPNRAGVLIVTEGVAPEDAGAWPTLIEMFDGNDDAAIADARARWARYKQDGHALMYWKQSENGGWRQD
jgi:DNA polymerase-3 subunit chi